MQQLDQFCTSPDLCRCHLFLQELHWGTIQGASSHFKTTWGQVIQRTAPSQLHLSDAGLSNERSASGRTKKKSLILPPEIRLSPPCYFSGRPRSCSVCRSRDPWADVSISVAAAEVGEGGYGFMLRIFNSYKWPGVTLCELSDHINLFNK